jgi:hypothetical protein
MGGEHVAYTYELFTNNSFDNMCILIPLRYADLVGLQMSAQDDGITSDEQNNTYASGNKTNETIAVAGIESIDKTQSPEAFTSPVIAKSKEDLANEKKEASQVLNQIWKMVLQHPLWMFGGLLGINEL